MVIGQQDKVINQLGTSRRAAAAIGCSIWPLMVTTSEKRRKWVAWLCKQQQTVVNGLSD